MATGKSAISAMYSASNYGRRYGAGAGSQPLMDPRDMWKDPSTLRQANEKDGQFLDDIRVFATKRRMENDTEYFETEVDEAEQSIAPAQK